MYGFLLTVLILDGIFLSVVILLQAGKGGGLAAMGGGAAATEVLGGRQATSFLTRSSWISGAIFMVLALVLSIMSSRAQQPDSILLDDLPTAPQQAPTPILPGTGAPTGDAGAVPPPVDGAGQGGSL
ncbi:MAG: preprotein translocase subunit SecG [Gemmatimonadota bacterium]